MNAVKLSKYVMVAALVLSFGVAASLAVLLYEKENIVGSIAGDDNQSELNLSKYADENVVFAGTTVTYTYQVENNTRVYTINDIELIDTELGSISCPLNSLAPGANMTCTDTAVINQTTTNIATVSGILSDEPGTQASDTEQETVEVLPNIQITKDVTPSNFTEDGTASYTVTVTNPSTDLLGYTYVISTLTDNIYGDLLSNYCQITEEESVLLPGDSFICNFDAPVTCDDQPGITDTATVTGSATYAPGLDQLPVTVDMSASDSATVNIACEEPAIEVTKTANPASITEDTEVDYTVTVTNNIGYPGSLTSLSDVPYGDLNGLGDCVTGGTINDGDTYTCTFPGDVVCEDEPSLIDTVTAELIYTDEESGEEFTYEDTATAAVEVGCEEDGGPICGDGSLDAGEECDDGNNQDGDGCSSNCTLEDDDENGDDENGAEPGSATIRGKVYHDLNQNETLDVGESGLSNVTVTLLNNSGSTLETDQTDSNGDFSFDELDPGTYSLNETDPTGYMSSTPNSITGIAVAADDSSYHLFGDYVEEEEEEITTLTTPTPTTTPTTSAALPTTGPGDNPYPLFAALALIPLVASGYAFYRYKKK